MIKLIIILVNFFLVGWANVKAQPFLSGKNQGNIWMTVDSIGIDFNYVPPKIFLAPVNSPDWVVAVLCDTFGKIQYFDLIQNLGDQKVLNRDTQWIPNTFNPKGYYQSTNWFLPYTGSNITGYITYEPEEVNLNHIGMGTIYYNRLLNTLNQGKGNWFGPMNVAVSTLDSIRGYGAAPVRHANGRDWWVVSHRHGDDTIFVMLATPDTMNIVHRLKIGSDNCIYSMSPGAGGNGSEMVFSLDGTKLLNVNGEGLIEVYDFDRCSGLLNNAVQVEAPFEQNGVSRRGMYSSCFSPSGRFIFSPQFDMQTQTFELVQYDLGVSNPTASRYVIFTKPFVNSFFISARLAPDKKIYLMPQYNPNSSTIPIDTMTLSVINYPDSSGPSCGFFLNGFFVGRGTNGSYLSQAPNYDLGPIDGSSCDTLGIDTRPADPDTTVKVTQDIWPEQLKVYPNPVQEQVIIESGRGMEVTAYHLYDLQGKVLQESVFKNPLPSMEINIIDIPPGHYILEVLTSQVVYRRKMVKVGER